MAPQNQEKAFNLSILTVSQHGKFDDTATQQALPKITGQNSFKLAPRLSQTHPVHAPSVMITETRDKRQIKIELVH